MIAFAILLIAVAILAYFEARREKRMIASNQGGPDLNHNELVWRRLRNVGALVMVAVVFDGTEGWDALWMGLCHAAGAWGMFVLVHRLSLNLMRGMDWRYVAPWGNKTDLFWYRAVHFFGGYVILDLEREENAYASKTSIVVPMLVHRAGTVAYCFEALVLAASIVGAIMILTNT